MPAQGSQPGSFQVVQKIKASGNQVLLAVLDGDSYETAKSLGTDLSQLLPEDIRPRLCHVTRDKNGFGFSVSCPEGKAGCCHLEPPHCSTSLTPKCPFCSSCRHQGHLPAVGAAGRPSGQSRSATRLLAAGAERGQREELLPHAAHQKGACSWHGGRGMGVRMSLSAPCFPSSLSRAATK